MWPWVFDRDLIIDSRLMRYEGTIKIERTNNVIILRSITLDVLDYGEVS